MEKVKTLPVDLQTDFEVVGVVPGKVHYQGATVDLSAINKATATRLADDENFGYLVRKTTKK